LLDIPADLRKASAAATAAVVLVTATAVIVVALAFQYVGGYDPCLLCLQQRYAYYLGIPAVIAALALLQMLRPKTAAALLLLVGIGFVVNAGLGVYQAGAEWKFWDPPATCGTAAALPTLDAKSLDMDRVPAVCGVASWRFLGLSFAGWNAVFSALLAAGALSAALKATRGPG
jgi:disulfide bond formation protein DsbB